MWRTVRTRTSKTGGINELKRGYRPRNNLVKDGNGDLLADSLTKGPNSVGASLPSPKDGTVSVSETLCILFI
jgi:hypothetical protein